jgi:hypothetical protein
MVTAANAWTQKMAALDEGGHFDSALRGCSHF